MNRKNQGMWFRCKMIGSVVKFEDIRDRAYTTPIPNDYFIEKYLGINYIFLSAEKGDYKLDDFCQCVLNHLKYRIPLDKVLDNEIEIMRYLG